MNNWHEQFDSFAKKKGIGGLARIVLKPFIQSLLNEQKKELLKKLTLDFDRGENPCMECGDNGYERAKADLEALKKTL